jgi:hypothetical protein
MIAGLVSSLQAKLIWQPGHAVSAWAVFAWLDGPDRTVLIAAH